MKETFISDKKAQTAVEDELEQVGGNADDDIGDAMSYIREREILFGNNSLLAQYGPMLAEICTRNKVYTVSQYLYCSLFEFTFVTHILFVSTTGSSAAGDCNFSSIQVHVCELGLL